MRPKGFVRNAWPSSRLAANPPRRATAFHLNPEQIWSRHFPNWRSLNNLDAKFSTIFHHYRKGIAKGDHAILKSAKSEIYKLLNVNEIPTIREYLRRFDSLHPLH
jgi:hypothetical protein